MTLCTLSMNAETSMFYNLPEGAFVSGMTSTAAMSSASVYLPYSPTEYIWTSTTGSGDWYLNDKKQKTTEAFSQSYQPGYAYYIPVLKQEGYTDYQYGNGGTAANMRVYGGTASVVYMTPAKLWCDKVQASSGQAQSMLANYKTTTNDVMGVFFNNKDIMYIDGISIPVNSNTPGQTVDDLFPNEGSHIIVNIYPATIIKGDDGKYTNTADRTSPLWTGTLTKTNFSVNSSSSYRGGVNVTFDIPISVSGPFCVELSDMKNSGCAFYIYSAKERTGCNFFGYYLKDGVETYPNPYTLAVSVHAMFPALYKDDASVEEIQIVKAGGDAKVTIHSNVDPKNFTITSSADWISYNEESFTYEDTENGFKSSKKSNITFAVAANEGAPRKGTITLNNRGKKITYSINQQGYASLSISDVEWSTSCFPSTLTLGTKYDVYTLTLDGNSIVKTLLDKDADGKGYIPSNTPVLIHGPKTTFTSSTARYGTTDKEEGNLVGVYYDGYVPYDPEGDYEYYVLQNLDSGLGFYRVNSSNFAIKANRAYLKIPKASAAKDFLSFEETPTGINEINSVAPVFDNKVYNIQGVSVGKNYKGIVISNGKKYIIK